MINKIQQINSGPSFQSKFTFHKNACKEFKQMVKDLPAQSKGISVYYKDKNGDFNFTRFSAQFRTLFVDEMGNSKNDEYVMTSMRKSKKTGLYKAILKHYDQDGVLVKKDEMKFNPTHLLKPNPLSPKKTDVVSFIDYIESCTCNKGHKEYKDINATHKVNYSA